MIYVVAISPKQCWLIWHSASVLWLYLTILIRMFELGRQAKKDSMARYGSTCYLSHSVPVSLSVSDSVSLQLYAFCTLMKRRWEGGGIIILFIFQVHLNPSFDFLLIKISLKILYVKQSTSLKFGVIIKKFMVGTHRFSIRYTAVESSIMDRKLMGSDDARNFASG